MDKNNSELKKYFYDVVSKDYNKSSSYDYLVLFSGGKDSSYLAHLMKQAKGGRVCLLMIDNGFEKNSAIQKAKKNANLLKCDLYIYQPPNEQLIKFYNFLITESSLLELNSNPLCFFCTRYFIALGLEFAERNNIPFVIHGGTPEQINQRIKIKSLKDIQMFDQISKIFFKRAYNKLNQLERYKNDKDIRLMVDKIFYQSKKVKIIFPFQYLLYHVENIKETLEKEYGWQNPIEGLSNKKYLSSGCGVFNILGVLKKYAGFKPHEMEEVNKEYSRGIMSKEAYEHNKKMLEDTMKGDISPEIENTLKKLKLKKLIINNKGKL